MAEEWFVEVDFNPSPDGGHTVQEWHCSSVIRGTAGVLLEGVTGFDQVFVPYNNVRSIGISKAGEDRG